MSKELEPANRLPEEADYEEVYPDDDPDPTHDERIAALWEQRRSYRAQRVSAFDCRAVLSGAKSAGHIYDFKKVKTNKGTRWVITTVPTRYDFYHDPDAKGIIALSNREVMVFMEGIWAGKRMKAPYGEEGWNEQVEGARWNPVNRAGDYIR